jgi:hypothetical protein
LNVIVTACSRELPTPPEPTFTIPLRPCCGAPPERLIHDPRILEHAPTVILVRVIGFEMLNPDENSIPAHATMLVLKSWKGLFCAGDVVHTPKGSIQLNGNAEDFISYPFQAGDQGKEFLIMDNGGPHIYVRRYCLNGAPEDFLTDPFQAGNQGKEFLIMDNGGPPPPDILKSWKGPFCAGDGVHTPKVLSLNCNPEDFLTYPFQVGDLGTAFLIMDNGGPPPPDIFVGRYSAWPAEKSQALMAALDQAVVDAMPTDKEGYAARLQKELAALENVTTELQVAQSNRAPEAEIADLSYQLRGHRENAARLQVMMQQLKAR